MTFFGQTQWFFSLVFILSDFKAIFDIVNYPLFGHASLLSSLLLGYLLRPPSVPLSLGILPGLLSFGYPLSPGLNQQISV